MQFDEANVYLLSLGHETLAIKLGLRNIKLLLEALGNPHHSYPSVQIAGTNGKGSTAVMLQSICRAAGLRTGLYTSPHLTSIVERLRVSGDQISQSQFAICATAVRQAAEELLSRSQITALPTFFEQLTAIALLFFQRAGVQLSILETGLGGRLDATTAAGSIVVGLTPIAFDHEEYLGYTMESIAAEKAAIIRPGVSVIAGPQGPEAQRVIQQRCADCGIQPQINECKTILEEAAPDGRFRVSFTTARGRYEDVLVGLRGRHQIANASLAIQLAESLRSIGFAIDAAAIATGIENVNHPGRLELRPGSPAFLFDGAHNPAGAITLREYLDEFVNKSLTLVFGVMRDKKIVAIAQTLFPVAAHVILTRPANPRAASGEEILRRLVSICYDPEKIILTETVPEAIQVARQVTPLDGLICVCGSLYLIGEVQAILDRHSASCSAGFQAR